MREPLAAAAFADRIIGGPTSLVSPPRTMFTPPGDIIAGRAPK
jgi:hypothetical protein